MEASAQTIERALNLKDSPETSPRAYKPLLKPQEADQDQDPSDNGDMPDEKDEHLGHESLGDILAGVVAPRLQRSAEEKFPPHISCPKCGYKKGDLLPQGEGSPTDPLVLENTTLKKQIETLKKDILKFQRLLRPQDKSMGNLRIREVEVSNFGGTDFRVDWNGQVDEFGYIFGKGIVKCSDGNVYFSENWETKTHKLTGKSYLQTGYGSKTDTLEYLDGSIFKGKISPGFNADRLMHRYKGKLVPLEGREIEGEWDAKETLVREIKKVPEPKKQSDKSPDKSSLKPKAKK